MRKILRTVIGVFVGILFFSHGLLADVLVPDFGDRGGSIG